MVAGFGVETSMWQRHTHAFAFSGASERSAAGCGSCTRQMSQPRSSSRAFISLYWNHVAHCSSVQVLRVALERVVHELRRVEELLAAVDDLPLDLEPHVAHERDQRVEDLRHAAAERRRAELHDPRALQRLGQLADLLDQRATDDVGVVRQALVSHGDGLEHS